MKTKKAKHGIGLLIAGISGLCAGIWIQRELDERLLAKQKQEKNRLYDSRQLLIHWIEVKNAGYSLAAYFEEFGYQKIAIYGMGELANLLCEDLQESNIEVAYGIDQEVCNSISRIQNVYSPNDELDEADAVVVTPFYAFDQIREEISKKVKCPILSIEEVIWSI